MKYVSTRGEAKEASFENILASGTASDGGLFVPSVIPKLESAVIDDMKNLSYTEIAEIVIKPFIGDFLQKDELQKIIEKLNLLFNKEVYDKNEVIEILSESLKDFNHFELDTCNLKKGQEKIVAKEIKKIIIKLSGNKIKNNITQKEYALKSNREWLSWLD